MNTLLDTPTHKILTEGSPVIDSRTSLPIGNVTILVNGENASQSLTGDYVADIQDTIEVTAEIRYGQDISYPNAVLKMPVVRYSNGSPTDDEIYWNTTILNGVMKATGAFPRSGDWKFVTERINSALQRAGADWKIEMNDQTILV